MKLGMNLSYLEHWWDGAKDKNYADFVKTAEVQKRRKMFADISKAGFKTVRIPINFGAWANYQKPYKWEQTEGLKAADLFVKWALENDLNAIVDLHHVEFDGKLSKAATTERIVWLWQEIAARYKNRNPEKVFFELRNEPHDIKPGDWRSQAREIIKAVRKITPDHTLIVGFHDWNGRQALIDSEPFADPNIIYTFHYYDPFIFTHQRATWAGEGLSDLAYVPFPARKNYQIQAPSSAKGKWVETLIGNYEKDSNAEKMFSDLKAVQKWSKKYKVPVFMGEFGSFNLQPEMEDRCRHASVVYASLAKLNIPGAWWEWDGGFTMFDKGTDKISDCMQKALNLFNTEKEVE